MKSRVWTILWVGAAFMTLIFDSKTALYGASEAIGLCLYTVVPSLFPFFVLSILLTGALSGGSFSALHPLGRLCRIPRGSETLLLTGILGGYPTGAQCIYQAYKQGQLSKHTARRMLGFCNNPGPAFIFGILALRFTRARYIWALWLIQILSALMVGCLLPGHEDASVGCGAGKGVTVTQGVKQALRITAEVCGWIIIFRILLAFADRWFLWLFPQWLQVLLCGIAELTNGCYHLNRIASEQLRFILCSVMLSFGGLCVALQTRAVTKELGMGEYPRGKLLQCMISAILSAFYCLLFMKN